VLSNLFHGVLNVVSNRDRTAILAAGGMRPIGRIGGRHRLRFMP